MKPHRLALSALVLLAACPALLLAQLDPSLIGKPPVNAWPTYHGDYSGDHYSTLTQINQSNVKDLSLAWTYRADTATNGKLSGGTVPQAVPIVLGPGALSGGLLKATPLMANGVLYMSSPDHVWAIDARSGSEIWHYYWRTTGGDHIGNRGVALYGNWLFFESSDGYVVSLNAASGAERWHKQISDVHSEYITTVAPVIIKNHLILGLGGDSLDVPGWIESRNPDTGEVEWRWYTTPRPGEPGADTWPNAYAMEHGGGMPWQPVTFDPDLNLMYVPTGNPNPVYRGSARVGNNLYTASIVALNPDTGKMVWYFQCSPHDTHDWDATQVPVLFDGTVDGKPRKLLMQASRNGMFFVLDRVTGKNILSVKYAESANWSKGFDPNGSPIPDPAKDHSQGGTLISPNNGGAQNWMPPTFDPETGLLYFNLAEGYEIHFSYPTPQPAVGSAGHATHAVGGLPMVLTALDYKTGKPKWTHVYAGTDWNPPRPELAGGLLSTAGHLLFVGNPAGFMVAYDPSNGKILWHVGLKRPVSNPPITYMLDGRQYLVFASGDELYAFTLPQ